jgi:DNA polymerase IV
MEAPFLAPLPIRNIPGIGEVTEKALLVLGIHTVDQLASYRQERLEKVFGQWGTALYRKARGGDAYEFLIDAEPKSISHNHTFGEDTANLEELESLLSHLSQKTCKRLREAGLCARTLTLTIRYAGFQTYTRSKTLTKPVNLDSDIYAIFLTLFREHLDKKRKVRLLGTAVSGFSHGDEQLDLLEADRREKLAKLTKATDQLRNKFGFDSLQFGASLRRDDT